MYLNLSQTVNVLRVGVDNVSFNIYFEQSSWLLYNVNSSANATPNLEEGNVSTAFLLH